MRKTISLLSLAAFLLAGCEGTQTGKSIFGTPSNNQVTAFQLTFPTPPNRSLGTQYLALQVNALDTYNNVITVPYNTSVTLSSNNACAIGFSFYQNIASSSATPPPTYVSLNYNSPQEIGVVFNPNCGGANPVVITASASGAASYSTSF